MRHRIWSRYAKQFRDDQQDISEPLSKDSDDLARRKEGRAAAADWSEPLLDVRLAAHNRLNLDITPCLLSADSVETVFLGNKR
jgi:hypothetical protein